MRTLVRGGPLALGLIALVVGVGFLGNPRSARAASVPSASLGASTIPAMSVAAPIESNKIVLHETSIDGPAFWTNVPIGEPGAGATAILAWTGTDAGHHLNTMNFSAGPSGYTFGNKQTLGETSIAHPAVTVQPSQVHPAYYFVAWTGTNAAHSLNVICDGCASSRTKLTLWQETSFAAPAVAMLNGKLMLAWTGTDANHSLNVLDISIVDGAFVVGTKTTLVEFSSNAGPGLVFQPTTSDTGKGIILTWSDRSTARIKAAFSDTGTNWPRAGWITYSEFSAVPPNMLALVPMVDIAHTYLAWTGTDSAHSLNLLYPAYLPLLTSTKATLAETALGGPALGYIGGSRLALMWTGTDSLHHLNFATIDV